MSDLYRIHMPHWPKQLASEPPGTPAERTRSLLAALGNPEKKLPPVVHVGGTKGKGSTIAFLHAMLTAAGYKVHCYTSPHLAKFNERIVLAGREIDDTYLHDVIERTRIVAGDRQVGFFDATTAAAVLAFVETPADIMLMEMGLGGSVDATNFLNTPRLTILTTVSYDHMEFMGFTLPEIADFEAGLFKPNVPCVVSYQPEEVTPVIETIAAQTGAPLYSYGKHWLARNGENAMVFADSHGQATLPLPSLLGSHQIVNAGNAIAALSVLDEFDVSQEHVIQGLTTTQWKGRLQQLQSVSLPKECELWFDGGHNMAAGQAIALFARQHWQDRPLYMVFGTTRGKDVYDMLEPFAELVDKVYAVRVKSEPKSDEPTRIAQVLAQLLPVEVSDGIREAVEVIVEHEHRPFRVLVFGSLYLWLEAMAM